MKKNKRSSLSNSKNVLEMGKFWSIHDLTEFNSKTYPVKFDVELKTKKEYVALLPELVKKISKYASSCGLSIESVINTWLQQKVDNILHK